MKKPQLIELSQRVSEITEIDKPIIVGSQSLYALTNEVPEIVKKSVECDFLLINVKTENFRRVIAEIGFASEFQEQNGYFADALGLATVVLTEGWQERLVEMKDDAEQIIAYCLEINDLAVSKLLAGREKDFEFIEELFNLEILDWDNFSSRFRQILDTPSANALEMRIQSLSKFLQHKKSSNFELKKNLKNFKI